MNVSLRNRGLISVYNTDPMVFISIIIPERHAGSVLQTSTNIALGPASLWTSRCNVERMVLVSFMADTGNTLRTPESNTTLE